METYLTTKKLTIRDTSKETTVANNPKAKLMYYLYCVSCVVKAPQLEKYINYKEYYNIPDSEIDTILELAKIFNPKILVEYKIFIMDETLDMQNRFIEIVNEERGIHANDEIYIEGIKVRILKLMRFKRSWVFGNYLDPYESLTRRDQNKVIDSYRNENRVYSRGQDPIEELKNCNCDCNVF